MLQEAFCSTLQDPGHVRDLMLGQLKGHASAKTCTHPSAQLINRMSSGRPQTLGRIIPSLGVHRNTLTPSGITAL